MPSDEASVEAPAAESAETALVAARRDSLIEID